MIENLEIKVSRKTRMVNLPRQFISVDGENLQSELVFSFIDEFVNGQARLEYEINSKKNYIILNKQSDTYTIPIKNILTINGQIDMQLVITESENENGIPVFKSNKFYLYCNESINAVNEAPDGYELWIDHANSKLNEIENLDIDVTKTDDVSTVTITKKDGSTKSVEIKDAKINGHNTIEIIEGKNIKLEQKGNQLKISSIGGGGGSSEGGTSNYNDLSNKPKINNVELNGNKSLNDLGIQPSGNYALESEIPTKTSDLTNDSGFITGYTETDPTVPSHVKNITQKNITNWNNKSDFSGNYNDLTNKPTIPSEVTETTVSNWGFTKNIGTITGITMNGVSKGTSGVVDLGTVITSHQDISGKANKISVVQTSASTIEINSNTFYKFGEVASLNITLASITDNTIYNEYMFEFVSGTTATTLTLPDTIKWLETPTIESNKIYQCSIVDNIGILVGVAYVLFQKKINARLKKR